MSEFKPLGRKERGRTGKFTDVDESLLPLFSHPGERDEKRWRLLFGLEQAPPLKRGAAFIARDLRPTPPRKA